MARGDHLIMHDMADSAPCSGPGYCRYCDNELWEAARRKEKQDVYRDAMKWRQQQREGE